MPEARTRLTRNSFSSNGVCRTIPQWDRLLPKRDRANQEDVRIFNRATLRAFWQKHRDAEGSLRAWVEEVEASKWTGPQDIRKRYRSADFLANERVVFNIRGNNYRLVVHVVYRFHAVYVRFIGTHANYDEVDASKV